MNLVKYKSRRATHPCDMYMVTFSAGALLTDTRLRKQVQHIASAHKATVGLHPTLNSFSSGDTHIHIHTYENMSCSTPIVIRKMQVKSNKAPLHTLQDG